MAKQDTVVALKAKVAELDGALVRVEERAAAIQEIAAAVGSSLELSEVLQIILDKVTHLLEAERSTLFLLNEDRDKLVSVIAQGSGDEEIEVDVGEGLAGWVARTGRSVSIKDAYQDPRFDASWDERMGFKTRAVLCVPMRNLQRRILGVVEVLNKRGGGYFPPADERLLAALAGAATVTIENAKLYSSAVARNVELMDTQDQLERTLRELDALFEVEREISRAADLTSMMEDVLGTLTAVLDAQAGSVVMLSPGGGASSTLAFRAAVGEAADDVLQVRLAPGEGIIGWVAANAQAVKVDDVTADPRHSARVAEEVDFAVRSELAAPIVDGENCIGAISVLNRRGDQDFTDEDLKLLQLAGSQLGRAIVRRQEWDAEERQHRLATIGSMLSGVIHDLKTPMTIISGYVQLMARKHSEEERSQYAELVLGQFQNMNAMTREVLNFARGDSEVLLRKVYLNEFVRGLRENLERQLELEPADIELFVTTEDLGVARFDETKIHRALQNLVRNAIEAMPDGGELSVEFARSEGDLLLTVADTGLGIPDEIRDVLFESFVTTGKRDGTGLGLAIVQRIVQDHDGEIEFESGPDIGTTFTMRLPQDR